MHPALVALLCTAGVPRASAAERRPLPFVEGSATVVVLPDTEVYTDKKPAYLEAQMEWVAENLAARAIACLLHVGDVTNNNTEREWRAARECLAVLAGKLPCILAAGNHDYDNTPGRLTRMNEFLDVAGTKSSPAFGGLYEAGHLENQYRLVAIHGREWIILSLECGPRNAVIAWAHDVLARHESRPAIVLTHAYLYYENQRYDHRLGSQRASPHGFHGEGADGEELWNKLIRTHPNVMLVICGHLSSAYVGYRADEGDYGNVVHQMMCDYEKMRDGGMGYLRLLEFLPDGKTVQVRTYSPVTGETNPRDPALEEFAFELRPRTRDEPRPAGAKAAVPLSRAPIHRYSFDGKGAGIPDAIGKAHGRLNAGGSGSALDGEGRLVLAGDGRVLLPPRLLAGLDDVSFEVWFTPLAERYDWHSIVRFGNRDDWLTYVFRTLTVHRAEIAVNRHNEDIQCRVPAKPGTPLHVAVTYDHDGADGMPLLSCYRDGALITSMRTGLKLADVEDTANTIGPFAGRIDELRIYDYPLGLPEVRASFDAGADALKVAGSRAPSGAR